MAMRLKSREEYTSSGRLREPTRYGPTGCGLTNHRHQEHSAREFDRSRGVEHGVARVGAEGIPATAYPW